MRQSTATGMSVFSVRMNANLTHSPWRRRPPHSWGVAPQTSVANFLAQMGRFFALGGRESAGLALRPIGLCPCHPETLGGLGQVEIAGHGPRGLVFIEDEPIRTGSFTRVAWRARQSACGDSHAWNPPSTGHCSPASQARAGKTKPAPVSERASGSVRWCAALESNQELTD